MAQPCALNSPKYIPSKSLCLVMFTFYYHLAKKTPSYLEGRDTEEIYLPHTGKSFSEALILVSANPQYDKRLFIELRVQYMKTTILEHVVYTNCFLFLF